MSVCTPEVGTFPAFRRSPSYRLPSWYLANLPHPSPILHFTLQPASDLPVGLYQWAAHLPDPSSQHPATLPPSLLPAEVFLVRSPLPALSPISRSLPVYTLLISQVVSAICWPPKHPLDTFLARLLLADVLPTGDLPLPTHTRLPNAMPLDVFIPPRRDAITLARTTETKRMITDAIVFHVFCDASSKRLPRPNAGIGIVVNMWHPRESTKRRTTKACFIPYSNSDHNDLMEAFALAEGTYVAIDQILGLMDRSSVRSSDRFEIRFWSDSKVVLRALQDSRRFRAHNEKMQHVLHIIELKARHLESIRSRVSIQFRWCPEECVEPHQTADELSKMVRISGGNTESKARALFRRLPHSAIEEALDQRLQPLPPVGSVKAFSTIPASRAMMNDAATNATQTSLLSEDIGSQEVTHDLPQSRPTQAQAVSTISFPMITDPVTIDILHEAAGLPRFFSIIDCAVNSLPPHQRPCMHDAIRRQQYANKKMRVLGQDGHDPAGMQEDTEPRSPGHLNLFALVKVAALQLPDTEKEMILASIEMQKKANECRVRNEAKGQVYESVSGEHGEHDKEPDVLQNFEALIDSKTSKGPVNVDGSEAVAEHKIIKESCTADKPTVTEKLTMTDESNFTWEPTAAENSIAAEEPTKLIEDPKVLPEPEVFEEPQAFEEPEVFEDPEVFQEAPPSRMRAMWMWVERRLQRL